MNQSRNDLSGNISTQFFKPKKQATFTSSTKRLPPKRHHQGHYDPSIFLTNTNDEAEERSAERSGMQGHVTEESTMSLADVESELFRLPDREGKGERFKEDTKVKGAPTVSKPEKLRMMLELDDLSASLMDVLEAINDDELRVPETN